VCVCVRVCVCVCVCVRLIQTKSSPPYFSTSRTPHHSHPPNTPNRSLFTIHHSFYSLLTAHRPPSLRTLSPRWLGIPHTLHHLTFLLHKLRMPPSLLSAHPIISPLFLMSPPPFSYGAQLLPKQRSYICGVLQPVISVCPTRLISCFIGDKVAATPCSHGAC
jgi:hypothetical protein